MSTTSAESSWKALTGDRPGRRQARQARGNLERYGVGTHGSGAPGQAKVHGHPVIAWERVVRIGAKVVVHD
jgi:hypothetical protein